MKIQTRKNGTIVITCDVDTVEHLVGAASALERHYWSCARALPEGMAEEKRERQNAAAAERLGLVLLDAENAAKDGRVETIELTGRMVNRPTKSYTVKEAD